MASLLALNGLRISEALGADIENLEQNRGHRTLFIHRQGHKTATIPLAPLTARAIALYVGERETGPIFLTATASTASTVTPQPGSCDASPSGRESTSGSRPPRYGTASSPPTSTLVFRCGTFKKPLRIPTLGQRCATTVAEDHSTGTPPTSWRPSSQAPAAEQYGRRRPSPGRRPYRSRCRICSAR